MAFISDDPVIADPAAPAPTGAVAPAQPAGFVTNDKPVDEIQELAKDDAFDPVDFHLQNGESDESLTKAAQVMEARHKLPKKGKLARAAEFGGGVFEEVANLGQDIWHALPGTGAWDGEAKSSVGTFIQGLGSAGTNAITSIADEPGIDPAAIAKGENPPEWAVQDWEGQDTWLKRLETRKHNYEVALKNEEPARAAYLKEHGNIKGFVSAIPAENVVGPQEQAAFDTVAARSAQNAASLRLGALHGGETALKAYRWAKGGEDDFKTDDWRVRIAEDASMRKAGNELKQGKMDNSDERGGVFAGGPDITPEAQERLYQEGQINPETIEKQSVVGDPTNIALMEALRLPIVNKSVGAGLRLSGKAMEAVGGAVDKLIGKTGGKVLVGAGAAGGTYLVGEHLLHGDVKPLGAALALFAARFALTRAGRLIGESGKELMAPEAFNSRAALSAAEAGQATAAAGGRELTAAQQAARNFMSVPDNVAAGSRIARRTVQGVGIGTAGAVPFAALADNPEQAGKAIGGGIAFGATLGPLGGSTENPGLNRAMEINKAATRLLADKGAAIKFTDPNLQRQHDTATEDLSYTVKTYVDALKGLFSGFKGRNGQNMNIAILEPADFAAQLKERGYGLDPAKPIDAHGFFDADSGTVFINKGNLRVDAAGHEGGHFLSNDVMRQMGKAYGSAMRTALEDGLFVNGRPTPEFKKFIDDYNAATPGTPIPYLRGKGPILQHRAVGEYVAETTRAILGEPNVGKFTLPKDVSDRMADKLVAMYGDATAEKGADLFSRTDLPTVNKAVKDVIFDLGRGMKPEPQTGKPTRSGGEPVTPPDGSAPVDVAGTPDPITPQGALTPTAPEKKKEEPFEDVGLTQDVVDAAEGNHVNWPQPPEPVRANAKRRIKGRTRDQVAEERLADWNGMFQKYVEYLRANGLQAPNEPRQLALDVAEFAMRSDAGAPPVFGEPATPAAPAESGTSIETKSEPQAALAEPAVEPAPVPGETRGALGEPEPAPTATGERPPALQDAPEAPAAISEAEAVQRATEAENTAVQSPEFKRKRNDVTRAEHRRNARVSALLEVAGEDAANMGDSSMLQRRTDEDGNERFTGKLDPENIASHRLLLRELGVQPDGDAVIGLLSDKVGQTVYLDYQSAPKEKGQEGDISGKQRAGELRKSTAEDRRTGGDHTLQEGKAFHVLGFKVFPGKGSVTLFGFSPDKWIANAGKLMTHLQEQGVAVGYEGVNDPQMLADMDGYAQNHKNGYKGDGSAPVAGVEATGEPYLIPKDKFDLLNAALNFDISTKGESKRPDTQRGALEAQERASTNDVALDPETGDASPLRAYVNKSGKLITPSGKGDRVGTGANLEGVYENIAPDLVQGISEEPQGQNLIRPTGFKGNPGEATKSGIPNSDYAASGFMPDSGASMRPQKIKSKDGSYKIVHETTREDTQRYQITTFDKSGNPTGHTDSKDLADALISAGKYDGLISKADELEPHVMEGEKQLKKLGIQTGDFVYVSESRPFGPTPPSSIKERAWIDVKGGSGQVGVLFLDHPLGKENSEKLHVTPASMDAIKWHVDEIEHSPKSNRAGEFMPSSKEGGALEDSSSSIETKSPEFKRWFGESKVTNEQGEPMEVYHGTSRDFSIFKGAGANYGNLRLGDGFYFTPTESVAKDYASKAGSNPRVEKVYLSLKNPLIVDSVKTYREEAMPDLSNPRDNRTYTQVLRDKGYDGIILNNPKSGTPEELVAFDSNQIKSATHNSGDFDPANPDIRFMPGTEAKGVLEEQDSPNSEAAKKKTMDARRRADFMNQMGWLDQKAKENGFEDMQDMAENGGDKYAELANEWRENNPRYGPDGEQLFMPLSKNEVEAGGSKWAQNEIRDAMGDKLVMVKVPEFDKAWSKDGEDFYIPKEGGGGEIAGRIKRFQEWRKKGETIEAPLVYVDEKGAVSFINGRHRFSAFRNEGAEVLPVSMDQLSIKRAKELGLLDSSSIETKSGEFMPKSKSGALEDVDPLGFYSGLSRIIEDKIPNRASGEQILATIKGAGAKAEEIESTGLEEFLKTKSGPVSKQELADFVKAGGVQLKEVTKGGAKAGGGIRDWLERNNESYPSTPDEWMELSGRMERRAKQWQKNGDQNLADKFFTMSEEASLAAEGVDSETGSTAGVTKFSQYQLPGGENYKEVLLTLPEKDPLEKQQARIKEIRKERQELANDPSGLTEEELNQGLKSLYEEENRIAREIEAHGRLSDGRAGGFRSSHWDEPNVLAHIRQADHTDTEGNKVRLIEEIQSDWHQKGRKEGYNGGTEWQKRLAEVDRESDAAQVEHFKIITDAGFADIFQLKAAAREGSEKAIEALRALEPIRARIDALEREAMVIDRGTGGLVPDAPFKKTWAELAFKRTLRMAVEDGMDKIAWTPGEQQAERYDLSKTLDKVEVRKIEGTDRVTVYASKDNQNVITKQSAIQDLPDVIGKELAQKFAADLETSNSSVKEGLDLKVGGEGMKGFYDKILPDFVKKYVKKWGGKVETTKLDGGYHRDWEMAERKGETVHSVTITPEMRKAIMEGQPLFMGSSGQPKGALDGEGSSAPGPMRPRAAAGALQDDD